MVKTFAKFKLGYARATQVMANREGVQETPPEKIEKKEHQGFPCKN